MIQEKIKDEYYFLTERLEEINLALNGECNDIDCDRYMCRLPLMKKYKPILQHSFSCINSLKRDKAAILIILSKKRYKKHRYTQCNACRKVLDKLGDDSTIASFTKKSKIMGKKVYEWKGFWVHEKCRKKVKAKTGWEKAI